MSTARILHELETAGVSVHLERGKLKLVGTSKAVARVKDAVLEHRAEIIRELSKQIAIPEHVQRFLIDGQYFDDLPDWNPESCRKFLKQLEAEFNEFEVHGWHGCRMPDRWPEEMRISIQSIYIQSIQPEQEVMP